MKKLTIAEKNKKIKQLILWIHELDKELINLKSGQFIKKSHDKILFYETINKKHLNSLYAIKYDFPTVYQNIKLENINFNKIDEIIKYRKTLKSIRTDLHTQYTHPLFKDYTWNLYLKGKYEENIILGEQYYIDIIHEKLKKNKQNLDKLQNIKALSKKKFIEKLITKEDYIHQLNRLEKKFQSIQITINNHKFILDGIYKEEETLRSYIINKDIYELIFSHRNNINDYKKLYMEELVKTNFKTKKLKRVNWLNKKVAESKKIIIELEKLTNKYESYLLESGSNGEKIIRKLLLNFNIIFEEQKRFNSCINKSYLPFDFYVPSLKILIEFDGAQHFMPIELFGGEDGYKSRIINDNIKNNWAKSNNYKLHRIRYDEIDDIESIIKNIIKLS